MSKLTNKDRHRLETVLYDLKRAHRYIMSEQQAVCMRRTQATTTLDYTRNDGKVLYEVTKEVGSDLVGLQSGIVSLERYLGLRGE